MILVALAISGFSGTLHLSGEMRYAVSNSWLFFHSSIWILTFPFFIGVDLW